MICPTELACRCTEKTFTRVSGGYQSASSELWVGSTTARPVPAPTRMATSISGVSARAVPTENSPHSAASTVAMRTRLARSQ